MAFYLSRSILVFENIIEYLSVIHIVRNIYTKKLFKNCFMITDDLSFSIVNDVSIETIENLSLQ